MYVREESHTQYTHKSGRVSLAKCHGAYSGWRQAASDKQTPPKPEKAKRGFDLGNTSGHSVVQKCRKLLFLQATFPRRDGSTGVTTVGPATADLALSLLFNSPASLEDAVACGQQLVTKSVPAAKCTAQ